MVETPKALIWGGLGAYEVEEVVADSGDTVSPPIRGMEAMIPIILGLVVLKLSSIQDQGMNNRINQQTHLWNTGE